MDTDFNTGMEVYEDDTNDSQTDVHAALASLRSRAERRRYLVTQAVEPLTPHDVQRLVQELQVHQIELEMQYEEMLLAQAEAQSARAQYVDLYDFAPVGYFTLTAAGLIHQLNLCGSQMLGTVRQRLVGRRFALFMPAGSRVEFGQFLARIFNSVQTLSCEMVLLREDGTPFYAQLEGLRVENTAETDPAAPLCRLAVIDTTARRNATDALAASEARFRRLFNDSNDAVVLLQGHTYLDCNSAALRLLGASTKDQIVGQSIAHHAPVLQPDGRPTVILFRESVEEAIHQGSKRCTALMHRVTGEEIWVEAVLTPIEQDASSPLIHILWRDVTAERKAAAQLRESEARLSMALEASETGIFTWDVTDDVLHWDARSQAVFGLPYRPEPLPDPRASLGIHPEDKARVVAATNAALASHAPLALDYRVVWPDGSVHYVSSAGRVVADAPGGKVGFVGVLRDVTALYAAEEELHYKNLVLERMLNNMPMVLCRLQPDGTYLEAVGAGLRALGVENGDLVGRNALENFPEVNQSMQQVLRGESMKFLAELEVKGQSLAFQSYGFFDEQRQQAVVLSVDVTEVQQQKKQLKAEKEFTESLLENSVDGIVALDRAGNITAWNSQAARYFGHEAAAVIGRPIFEPLPRLDCDAARQVLARVLAGEQVVLEGQSFEHRIGNYDAYHVPLRQDDNITGVLVMFRDVTERDRLAEEATQLRLRQQQDVLSAILTTQESERKRIAEALHNGLGQLLYAAKLSMEGRGASPASPKTSLKLLHEAIRTTRTISFELTPGILEDFGLRTALEELSKRITPTGLPVHLHLTNLEKRARPQVEIAVYRIVQELLNNAMKHAHATEVVVHVARENGLLYVSVEDNGTGFQPDALTTLPLAGMGLSGVRNRVALLGGQLAINSQLGRGTIISFEVVE